MLNCSVTMRMRLYKQWGMAKCRVAVLEHAVEVDKEFCLTCELGFLFRMLRDAKGSVCQVSADPATKTSLPPARHHPQGGLAD